ncbi:hypothetical protein JCM14244_02990 [Venenivibrio stagnispumantis]|uniref:Uncharacterized protein n=1 Tax=Venenivibrio stagnispumantis TaxID=407998 RepID=A0AA45WMA2_9AQUI|nr:phosphate-starvation-inducible PsiE family protein [Venenivibrio stagnispumantis]MCW4572853.1 phosphate-starvation-inducible PsiE family protein [Venenivibrio stagnispumantis]SMP13102.1 hypothetical protein SAMN06264868_11047 [Venenivibrio stagnispumantis]
MKITTKIKAKFSRFIENLNNNLLSFFEGFYTLTHLFLAVVLVVISIGIFVWFIHDVIGFIKSLFSFKGNISSAAFRLLGIAILLWPLSGLLKAQIELLKGNPISITIWIDIGISGAIRAILLTTAEGGDIKENYYYIVIAFGLAIIRLLVVYMEYLQRKGEETK